MSKSSDNSKANIEQEFFVPGVGNVLATDISQIPDKLKELEEQEENSDVNS